ncbi:MAG: ribonuclease HI [Thiomicrorhabdus sp.]|nr:ribonuclease HI [Thiomicrorhabdus sp.]
MTESIQIHIYSDGGYFEKQDVGGWGAVIFKQKQELQRLSGWQKQSSSLEMELKAALNALQQFDNSLSSKMPVHYQITLFTDSRILIEGLSQKIRHWRKNDWIHKSGNPIKYKTLWEALDTLTQQYQINWQWVKGHNGNYGNTLADQLAREAVTERLLNREVKR